MKTQRFERVSGVSFTPDGGAALPIDGPTQVVVRPRATAVGFAADGDTYPRTKAVVAADPLVTVDYVEGGSLDGVEPGTPGVLTWTDDDAFAGADPGGGGKVWTAAPALFLGAQPTSRHVKQKSTTATFETFAPDGRTNPVQAAPA